MPRGGWLREVRRWACCGLWRTGGPSAKSRFLSGAFSSSPYTVPLGWVWLGARHRGIVELSDRIDVCDSVRLLYLLTYCTMRGTGSTDGSPLVSPARRTSRTTDGSVANGVGLCPTCRILDSVSRRR